MEIMQEILEVSKRLLAVYQQLVQAKITKDMATYHQNLDKIRKIRVEEKGLYSKIDKNKIPSIIEEMQSFVKNYDSSPSREERLVYNRVMENLYVESISVITPDKIHAFSKLGVSEKHFSACADTLISIGNEIDLLNICFLEDMINENNKHVGTVIAKKLETFYVCPLLEDEYLDAYLEVGSPILSSSSVAANSGLCKGTYDDLKMKSCIEKFNAYTSDFYQKVKNTSENEESFIAYSIILCYVRASLQFMSKHEGETFQAICMPQLMKITNNSKILSLFAKAFASYDKDRSKFEQLAPTKYNEGKTI